jgi:hypothetical protein
VSLSSLTPAVRAAAGDLRSAGRALQAPELVPPTGFESDEALTAWARTAAERLKRRRTQQRTAIAQARATATTDALSGRHDPWRRVDDAFQKLEAEFTSSSALKARLAEGRRSMSSKAERVVQENLSARVTLTGNRAEAALDPEGVSTLQDALPRWVLGWADYSQRAYEVDLHRMMDRLWLTREGSLPVPRPTFPALPAPPLPQAPAFPTVSQTIDLEGIGGVVKHARSVLYGVMSIGVLSSLHGRMAGSAGGGEPLMSDGAAKLLIAVAAVAAVAFGYVQYRAEQSARIERFEGDVGKRAEQAVKSVLSTWYARQNDKLLEHCTAQLHERRRALVQWYQDEVAPLRARDEAERAQEKRVAEDARRQLSDLERQTRDLDRAAAAMKKLLEA